MAKMRAVDAAMYVLEKEGITTAFGVPEQQSILSIRRCVSTAGFATFWRVMLKARRIWRKGTPAQRQGISAFVWGLPVLRART